MRHLPIMISVSKGDQVVVRDLLEGGERSANVMVAAEDLIITADGACHRAV